jgi:hypothetical protein
MSAKRTVAGAALLHPVAWAALVVLVVNDHYAKAAYPGWLTGKLSDFAGLLVLPLWAQALFEVAAARCRKDERRALTAGECRTSDFVLMGVLVLTALSFAAVKCAPLGCYAFRWGLGATHWPWHALVAWLRGVPLPAVRPVLSVMDGSDLVALPMLLVAWRIGRHRDRALRIATAIFLGATLLAAHPRLAAADADSPSNVASEPTEVQGDQPSPRPKRRDQPRTHDRFFLEGSAGLGVLFVSSDAVISNGFRQEAPSSARGVAFPCGILSIGGTPWTGVVVGASVGASVANSPVLEALGRTYVIDELQLELVQLGPFVRVYPEARQNLHLGAALWFATLDLHSRRSGSLVGSGIGGKQLDGFGISVEAGHGFWLSNQWSMGAVARVFIARLGIREPSHATVVSPTLSMAITWQ